MTHTAQYPYPVQPTVAPYWPPSAFPLIAPTGEPIYEVRVTQHVGFVVAWWQQVRTVRGTYQQCADALRQAQTLNLTVGWWSFLSVLVMNWIAIAENASAQRTLKRQAAQMARLVHPSAWPAPPAPHNYCYR